MRYRPRRCRPRGSRASRRVCRAAGPLWRSAGHSLVPVLCLFLFFLVVVLILGGVVFDVVVILVVVVVFLGRLDFERCDADHFKVRAALGATQKIPLVDVVFVYIEVGITLGTGRHEQSLETAAALLPKQSIGASIEQNS